MCSHQVLWTEGRSWLEGALALSDPKLGDAYRAAALFGAGVIASLQGHGATARAWLEESGTIARALGDRSLAAYSDSYIGVALGQEGQAAAEAPARAALAWFEEVGDLYGQRLALLVLATLLTRQGDLAKARVVSEQAVRVARAYDLGRELGIALQVLGTVQLQQRELDAAAATIADALAALRRDPQPFWIARALELMGVVECARARGSNAARLFGAAERRRERMAPCCSTWIASGSLPPSRRHARVWGPSDSTRLGTRLAPSRSTVWSISPLILLSARARLRMRRR